jgi:hypothetical protein
VPQTCAQNVESLPHASTVTVRRSSDLWGRLAACAALATPPYRPIDNRLQVSNLPHKDAFSAVKALGESSTRTQA